MPVEKIPRYIRETVESNLGDRFHGCSIIKEIGNSTNAPHIKIDAVTFSFSLLLIFSFLYPLLHSVL